MTSEIELLACPFCGEPAEADRERAYVGYDYKRGTSVAIYCTKCSADMTFCCEDFPQYETEELFLMLAEQWNRRKVSG